MNTIKNCSECKRKNTIETLYYYGKDGKYKTDLIAFCMCLNCFHTFRTEKLPFYDDIFQMSLYIGAIEDTEYFRELETARREKIKCIYCQNSKGDFRRHFVDKHGQSLELSERKPCVVKLFIKNRKKSSQRLQVGYLCGFCKIVYFNNQKFGLKQNDVWYRFRKQLPKSHPRYTIEEEERGKVLYAKYLRVKDELENKHHYPKEAQRLKSKFEKLQTQIQEPNSAVLYSLGGHIVHPTVSNF